MKTNKSYWFVAEIAAKPIRGATPFRVAIEAHNYEHACERIHKLYSSSSYGSYSYQRPYPDGGLDKEPAKDTDETNGARMHPLPSAL